MTWWDPRATTTTTMAADILDRRHNNVIKIRVGLKRSNPFPLLFRHDPVSRLVSVLPRRLVPTSSNCEARSLYDTFYVAGRIWGKFKHNSHPHPPNISRHPIPASDIPDSHGSGGGLCRAETSCACKWTCRQGLYPVTDMDFGDLVDLASQTIDSCSTTMEKLPLSTYHGFRSLIAKSTSPSVEDANTSTTYPS